MPTTRMAVGFYAVAGAESEAFPMSWAGAGWQGVLTKFQPNWLERRLEKANLGQKKGPFGSTKFRPVMPR